MSFNKLKCPAQQISDMGDDTKVKVAVRVRPVNKRGQ